MSGGGPGPLLPPAGPRPLAEPRPDLPPRPVAGGPPAPLASPAWAPPGDLEGTQSGKGGQLEARLGAYGAAPALDLGALQAAAGAFLGAQGAPPAAAESQAAEASWFDGLMARAAEAGDALLDAAEEAHAAPAEALAEATREVPVLGPLAQAFAWTQRQTGQVASGFLRGAGGLLEGVATMIAHPIDTAKGLATMASHVPMLPVNPLRLVQAGWDVAVEGKPAMETFRRNLDPSLVVAEDAAFFRGVASAFVQPYREAIAQGRYGEAVGRGLFEVVTTVASGGAAAEARVGVEGASLAARSLRLAEAASQGGRAAELAQVGRLAEGAQVARLAEGAQVARLAEGGQVARLAEGAQAARFAEGGQVARLAEGGQAARFAEGAGAAARGAQAPLRELVGQAGRFTEAWPPPMRQAIEEARTLLREALGDRRLGEAQERLAQSQEELSQYLRHTELDAAGQARQLAAIDADAARFATELPPARGGFGRVTELRDVEGVEAALELLRQERPEALRALYRQSYEAFGVPADEAFALIDDYTHSSSELGAAVFQDIGEAAKQAFSTPGAEGSIEGVVRGGGQPSGRARLLRQMADTRPQRQAFLREVLGLEPPEAYRVFRGTNSRATFERAVEAWRRGDSEILVNHRGVTSTSLDPKVASDFSRGGPRSITVDPDLGHRLHELDANPLADLGRRRGLPEAEQNFVTFDLDVPNEAVAFDKYTDGGFSVEGNLAQRSQREVLLAGPQKGFVADPTRAQIALRGRTYTFDQRAELFAELERHPLPPKS